MNAEESRGGAVFDITDSHKDALNQDTQLNHDVAQVGYWAKNSRIGNSIRVAHDYTQGVTEPHIRLSSWMHMS